ncbi:MAG: hypothetical protein RIS64_4578 [Bacteroidota bacterium]|jgi:hypothetical protein
MLYPLKHAFVVKATLKAKTKKAVFDVIDETLQKAKIIGVVATIGRGEREDDGHGAYLLPFKHVNSAFFEIWHTQKERLFRIPLNMAVNPTNMPYLPVQLNGFSQQGSHVEFLREFTEDYTIYFTFFHQ